MNPQNPEENKAQFPQPSAANVSNLSPDLQQFINTSTAPQAQQATEAVTPTNLTTPAAEIPPTTTVDNSAAFPTSSTEPTVQGISQIPTTEATAAVTGAITQTGTTPEGFAPPATTDASLGTAQAVQSPETQNTASQQLDPNILSFDPNALPKIENSMQGVPSSPDTTAQAAPVNPNFNPSPVVESPAATGTPAVLETNPNYIPPGDKAPEYKDMPNAEPLALGEQNAASQIQQSNTVEASPVTNSQPAQKVEEPASKEVITPIVDGIPILNPSRVQTTPEATTVNEQLPQPPVSDYSIPKDNAPVGFAYPDQGVKPDQDREISGEKLPEKMNTTSLEELPDDLAEEAESLKQKEDEAYEKAIGVIKLLKTDTKKGIIELKNLYLNSQMDQNEEELPKAA